MAAQKRPLAYSIFILVLIAIAAFNVRFLSFDGSIISVLPDRSVAVAEYDQIKDDYRNFSRDVTILVESDRLLTSAGLEDLRNLQLDVSLTEGVAKAISIFSTPVFDPQTGELVDWFPEEFGSDEEMVGLIDDLIVKFPQVGSLFSKGRKVAVIVASLDVSVQEDDKKSFIAYRNLRDTAEEVAPDDFKLSFTGLTPVGAEILSALIDDQLKLTLVGLLLGTAIAYYIFRSVLAALLCAAPPALTALWAFGLFSFFEVPINYLTTVLPTLALILAFADGIFLYFRWQTLCSDGSDVNLGLTEAIQKVGPASSLTSITTMLAFLSFSYAESEALKEFAYLGTGVVALAFVAVIIGLPLAIHWSIRFGLVKPGVTKTPMFQTIGKRARSIALRSPGIIAAVGLLLVIVFGVIQQNVTAEYKLTEYLPNDSDIRYGEELANDVIGGRALLLMSVPFENSEGFASPENLERLSQVEAIVAAQFGSQRVFSASKILDTLETPEARKRITDLAGQASDSEKSDFLSKNGDSALISIRLTSNMPVAEVKEETVILKKSLSALPFGEEVTLSGFPILMAVEFTNLIDQLRTSLMIAIALGILFIGIATRSPFITIAAITPNLLPIFFVLVFLYVRGGTINLSEVVALTVAFGIAVDNAVHLINVFDSEQRAGKEATHALSTALEEVGPALTAGTVIICVSVLVTQISHLPVVPVLGQLMISTLIVALIANLLILPANILTLGRLKNMISSKKKV
ncbi:MAG: MMPL family transporter [Salaquimonas sp.]